MKDFLRVSKSIFRFILGGLFYTCFSMGFFLLIGFTSFSMGFINAGDFASFQNADPTELQMMYKNLLMAFLVFGYLINTFRYISKYVNNKITSKCKRKNL